MSANLVTVVVDATRLPDGSDRVTFRGAFVDGGLPRDPADLFDDPPPGTTRQMFTVPAGDVVDVGLFRFTITTARGEGT